jgi:hypothetical protein
MTRLAVLAVLALAGAARADRLDAPTRVRGTLRGDQTASGELTRSSGFPAYTWRATASGLVRIELVTRNVVAGDNGGRAWRAYLRVLGDLGAAWSTNGRAGDADTARATLLVPVHAGDTLTILPTVCEDMIADAPRAAARYELTIEAAP